MPEIRKLDSRRRAVFPDRFSPGDQFIEDVISPDEVVFRLIKPNDAPLAKIVHRKGRPMIQAPLDRKKLAQALRDERDSR